MGDPERVEDQAGSSLAEGAGTGWLLVGLQRGVALSVVYGVLWMAFGWLIDRVTGSKTGAVTFGLLVTVLGLPVGALAGTLLAAICALVDWKSDRRFTRRSVAVRVIGTVAAVTALLAATALDFWAIFVAGPCVLGLVSLWVWHLPGRPPR